MAELLLFVIIFAYFFVNIQTLNFNNNELLSLNNIQLLNETKVIAKAIQSKLIAVSFVNGISHSIEDWERITNNLSQSFGLPVQSFYNPTSGSWIKDATKAGYELVVRPNDLKLAKDLAIHLSNILAQLSNKGRVLHIAHSGGAILTYLAAKYHLTKEQLERIDIITLGGGRSITKKYFHGYIVNYYSKNDPLILVDSRASNLFKKGKNLERMMLKLNNTNINITSAIKKPIATLTTLIDKSIYTFKKQLNQYISNWIIIFDIKHKTSFIFLDGLANDPFIDHSMEGPTYRLAIIKESIELQKRIQYLIKLNDRDSDLIRLSRKRLANFTGLHHFWNISNLLTITEKIANITTNITTNIYQQMATNYSMIMNNLIHSPIISKYINYNYFNISNSLNINESIISFTNIVKSNIRFIRKKSANITNLHGFISKKKYDKQLEELEVPHVDMIRQLDL